MKFTSTPLAGAFLVEPEINSDERGFFARTWCCNEFSAHGLNPHLVQCNISYNHLRGTLRGMHYQANPHGEAKLVRCVMGSVFDVIVDIRPDSTTFRQWFGTELSVEGRQMLFVPEGFAHGFITLTDRTEVFYQMSEFFHPESARGFRWDDPAIGIRWPNIEPLLISPKDRLFEMFS